MAGRRGFRAYPKHLGPPKGRGLVECSASGFVTHRTDLMDDVRQGRTKRRFADTTPGFGTRHPQDVVQLGALDDPKGNNGRVPDPQNLSRQDLGLTDADILESIRTGQPPKRSA